MRDEELRPLPEIAQLFRVSVKTIRQRLCLATCARELQT
jgi:DNA-directed RNA polymerase specialized sigma24 family protein